MASLTFLNLIVLPAFISSSDCCKDLRSRAFGISGRSLPPTARRLERTNSFKSAFVTALKESPKSEAVFCAFLLYLPLFLYAMMLYSYTRSVYLPPNIVNQMQ